MGEYKHMTQEQEDRVMKNFTRKLMAIYSNSSSGSDFKTNAEKVIAESKIKREPDGVDLSCSSDKESYDNKRREYADLYEKFANATGAEGDEYLKKITALEEKYPELIKDDAVDQILAKVDSQQASHKILQHAYSDLEASKAQADKVYYKTTEDRKPITENAIEQSFGTERISLNDLRSNIIAKFGKNAQAEPKVFHEECKKAAKKEWADTDKIAYRKNSYESNGKTYEYTQAAQKVDWGRAITNKSKSPIDNIEQLRKFISRQIYDYFGGFSRITSIVVRSNQLIVNNVCYMPLVDRALLKDASVFPLDSLEYIKNGYIAPLFNWRYLRKMSRLSLLDIDDVNFYINDVASDIGAGRRAGLSTIFTVVPSLEVFILGGDIVKEEEQNTEKGRVVKEKIARHKHFTNLSDSYKLRLCDCTNTFQNWAVGNLKTYACNKGNKCFLRYVTGILTRSSLVLSSGVINVVTNLATAVIDAIKENK